MSEIIHRNGHELEGAFNRSVSEHSGWHYDSSVEVSGGSEECECEIDCYCDECRRCEHSGENIDYCEAEACMRCDQCEDDIDDCECFLSSAFDKECPECKNSSFSSEEAIACTMHRYQAFNENCHPACEDTYTSCDGECGCERDCSCGTEVDGEMVSPPLKSEECEKWIRDNYPEQTNTTCGSHHHVSFKHMKYYAIVMDREFQQFMFDELEMWGKSVGVREGSAFYRRLQGDVHWCKNEYSAHEQIHTSDKSDCRYRAINYCNKLHGTMEVRVLPAFQDVDYTVSAHRALTGIIEQYVSDHKDSLTQQHKTITMEVMV